MKNKKLGNEYPFNLLTEYVIKSNNITEDTSYSIFEIDAKELIMSSRIDLMAKIVYIDFKERCIESDFAKELYAKHIEAFTNGTYVESGTYEKDSIDKYTEQFDKTIDSIKNNGFDSSISLIPIGKNNEILDGSHRVSSAAYFNKKVTVIKFPDLDRKFDYDFFKYRLLDDMYLDYMINEYCKYKEDVYLACVWPRANDDRYKSKIHKLIEAKSNIVCSKEINLTYNGVKNFMSQIYGHESWIGDYKDNFMGAFSKADNCYKKGNSMIVYVLESDTYDNILNLKNEIRDIAAIDKHSVHITDNQIESIQTAKLLFNDNSIYHLNTSMPNKYSDFNEKVNLYKEKIINNNLSLDDFIIDSSGAMGVFGIRKNNDIDFLSLSKNQNLVEGDGIEIHDTQLCHYGTNKDGIICDPRNYFIYNDLKFITLNLLKTMKHNRNEKKDKEDIKLIDRFLKRNRRPWNIRDVFIIDSIKRCKRSCKIHIKKVLVYSAKKVGLYNTIKRIIANS